MTINPGDIINQYRIVKQLGKGALVEVFLATHTFLNIDRAIKVLRKDTPNFTPKLFEDYSSRYKVEWQLAARVKHPNFIEVYDLFEHDGNLVAVMEYASGGTLEDRLKLDGKQPEDWVIEIMRDCAKGLFALHEIDNPSLVHCYVNPKTIVLDMNGRAKITNFGKARTHIAKLHEEQLNQHDDYNIKYQAPEFLRKKVGKTTDIYSLGCVAFRMLTGQDVIYAGTNSPRQLEPSVPRWLDEIIIKCLSHDACFSKFDANKLNKRYFDMTQILKALDEPEYIASSQLYQKIHDHFSIQELKTVCYSLNIDDEIIPYQDKSTFIREMLKYFQRRQNTAELIECLRIQRPHVDW